MDLTTILTRATYDQTTQWPPVSIQLPEEPFTPVPIGPGHYLVRFGLCFRESTLVLRRKCFGSGWKPSWFRDHGGSDELKFEINSSTGLLSFEMNSSAGMDFEVPVDADRDNVYLLIIGVSDGIELVDQNLSVTVTDENEQPENLDTIAALKVMENQSVGSFAGEFNATDQDANTILSYSLVSGQGMRATDSFRSRVTGPSGRRKF